jgi:hypothetical protein
VVEILKNILKRLKHLEHYQWKLLKALKDISNIDKMLADAIYNQETVDIQEWI